MMKVKVYPILDNKIDDGGDGQDIEITLNEFMKDKEIHTIKIIDRKCGKDDEDYLDFKSIYIFYKEMSK